MYKKYAAVGLISLLTIIASAFAGYYTTLIYTNKSSSEDIAKKQSYTHGINAQVTNQNDSVVISEKTQIYKKTLYLIGADDYKLEETEKPAKDIIGLNKSKYNEVVKKKGYLIDTFTEDKVVLIRTIKDLWPPNKFVLKQDGENISIFSTSADGKLKLIENCDVEFAVQPENIKERLKKGLIFDTKDEAEERLYEINS